MKTKCTLGLIELLVKGIYQHNFKYLATKTKQVHDYGIKANRRPGAERPQISLIFHKTIKLNVQRLWFKKS